MITKNDKLCFIGDSITDGIGTTRRYFDYIADITGATVHGYGVNGSQTVGLFDQLDRMEKEIDNDFDVLFVFIGTNDFRACVPLGEFFEEKCAAAPSGVNEKEQLVYEKTLKRREFIFDDKTFKGRLNKLFNLIKTKYFDKRIVMLTPIHRAFAAFGPENIQPDELFANEIGEFLDAYVKAEREAADIWSVELVDLYRESGLFPLADGSAELYFHQKGWDRLHPNANGHLRIAQTILRKV